MDVIQRVIPKSGNRFSDKITRKIERESAERFALGISLMVRGATAPLGRDPE